MSHLLHRDEVTFRSRLGLTAGLLLSVAATASAADYRRDIQPLLATKCVSCHGPVKQEGGLRLDAGVLVRKGSESGAVIAPTSPEKSPLLRRVTSEASEERMPPAEEGEPLTTEQVALLREWIAAGAPSPDDEEVLASASEHWAYRPIVKPALAAETEARSQHPLDRLLARQHASRQLEPLRPADRLTLLRRLCFDLTGLPPTIEEQERFLADSAPDAYALWVDELLARPEHGERWARHWMDVWRYSDWDGYKAELRGSQRHIWRWRDWIVEALHANKPYDRMIVEMLAGDEVAPSDADILRATGFLARNFHKSNRNIWLDATVEHTAKGFLGLTVNCARCHDHKYDPIDQREYYGFRAIFEPHQVRTDRLPGQANLMQDGLPRVYDADPDALTYVYLRGDEKQPDKEHPAIPAVPKMFGRPLDVSAVKLPAIARFPSLAEYIQQEDLATAETRLATARRKWDELDRSGEQSATARASRHGDRPPGPAHAIPLQSNVESARRAWRAAELELAALQARWKADRAKHDRAATSPADESQLAQLAHAAAAAERASDIAAAERDLFAELLKQRQTYTATETDATKRAAAIKKIDEEVAKGQSALAKARAAATITDGKYTAVGTEYPSTSTGRRLALAQWIVDPRNPLTARVAVNHVWLHHFGQPLVENVFDFGLRTPTPPLVDVLDWLAADLIDNGWDLRRLHRLIVTSQAYQQASSAETSLLAHNASIDPDNHLYWRANVRRLEAEVIRDSLLAVAGQLDLSRGGPDIDQAQGETVHRRSLYFRHAYEKQMTMLTTFDAANPTDCYRRSTSIVPQQALALSNSALSVSMARWLAANMAKADPGATDQQFIEQAFRRLLGRPPEARELETCGTFLTTQQQLLTDPSRLSAIGGQEKPSTAAAASPAQRARENLLHTLMNHNDFVTVR